MERTAMKLLVDAISNKRDHSRLFSTDSARTTYYRADHMDIREVARCSCGSMAWSRDDGHKAWLECPRCLGLEMAS